VILLAKSGVEQKEIAKILGISERTIRNWLPFRQIKQSRKEE
jgi:DNA-binding CsgD family transcriptional regulator